MTGRGSYRIRACHPGALEDRRELTSVMQRAVPEASQSLFTTLFTKFLMSTAMLQIELILTSSQHPAGLSHVLHFSRVQLD